MFGRRTMDLALPDPTPSRESPLHHRFSTPIVVVPYQRCFTSRTPLLLAQADMPELFSSPSPLPLCPLCYASLLLRFESLSAVSHHVFIRTESSTDASPLHCC
ncbi:hypothetical protein YC2023_014758 [Brassica napus]